VPAAGDEQPVGGVAQVVAFLEPHLVGKKALRGFRVLHPADEDFAMGDLRDRELLRPAQLGPRCGTHPEQHHPGQRDAGGVDY